MLSQESHCGGARRKFLSAGEEDHGGQAWKRRRLDDGNNDCQLISQTQVPPSEHNLYSAPSSGGIEYDRPSVARNGYNLPPSVRDRNAAANSSNNGGLSLDALRENEAECCYGMIAAVPVKLKKAGNNLAAYPNHIPVALDSEHLLSCLANNGDFSFEISETSEAKILSEVAAAVQLSTQLYCYSTSKNTQNDRRNHNGRRRISRAWFLNVILYGPLALEESIGDFFSQRHIYLQDPLGCDRLVVYRNPHIIQPEAGHEIMTDGIEYSLGNLEVERLEVGPNLLEKLMEDEIPLLETEAPPIIRTALFPHQKQALTFMLRRENGWALDEATGDIWSRRSRFGARQYQNNITGACQDIAPPPFQGGLLADEMGLGKTLSMISLIAANQAVPDLTPPVNSPGRREHGRHINVKTTLLVVPPPLIQSWQKQFDLHLLPNKFKINVLHGQNKKSVDLLGRYDIIITTFQTVSSIWRKQTEEHGDPDLLFSVNWHRVILDEAHTIQNPKSDLAQSCCALRSSNRWAITGTPIQNKLTDFASLVTFLQIYPYSEQESFDADILRPWRRGDADGFLRLKTLVRAITISRTKRVVRLPPREDFIHHLDFAPEELELYEDQKKQTIPIIRNALESCPGRKSFNALHHLNSLRLICSHGRLAQSYRGVETKLPQSQINPQESSFGDILDGNSTCNNCGKELLEDLLVGSPSASVTAQLKFTNSHPEACQQCLSQMSQTGLGKWSSGDLLEAPLTPSTRGSTPTVDQESPFPQRINCMPTKIKALAADLAEHASTEKSVVFSYWTYTLDLVQEMLDAHGIAYTRIDGKTSLPQRSEAMALFQEEDRLRVILVSITCGGAGLDLTAASRAYLLEPHWNPMIEEQALCRVHRVGQKRTVTTIRYLMRNSFEEQMVDIQKRKKYLAKVTFGRDPESETNIDVGILQYLKSVLE